jgi:hypothetical protein
VSTAVSASKPPEGINARRVFVLIQLNREYRAEAKVLETLGERRAAGHTPNQPSYARRVMMVLVDDFDLSTVAALRYAKSLRPTTLRAVHFVIDSDKAEKLRAAWLPDRDVRLEFADCPDRRLTWAAAELVAYEAENPGTQVTVILPRRSFSPLLGRLMHDRTADSTALVVSRLPNAAATIIPLDVQNRLAALAGRPPAGLHPGSPATESSDAAHEDLPGAGGYYRPAPSADAEPIGGLTAPGRAVVEGRVRVMAIRPAEDKTVLPVRSPTPPATSPRCSTAGDRIPGPMCGGKVRLRGQVDVSDSSPLMENAAYELLIPGGAGREEY